tara:strand:- start:187 stop:621 length:435 start_codon:yes stop_codon:yes gene_type:complete
MGNKHRIKLAQKDAKEHYDYYVKSYKDFKAVSSPYKDDENYAYKESKIMARAQIKIYAGIYNRDYGEFRKGLDKYKLYLNKSKEGELVRITYEDVVTEANNTEANDTEAHYTQVSDIDADYINEKIRRYETLYEKLPRNYFITN